VGAIALVRKIAPISVEILRRGELEHCERAKELLDRYAVATDEIAEFGDENNKYPKITALFLSRK
jgi:3-deoxy-D-manno-octulosonate 8-phosphate phosphatase KdsC-like HAD superfamily phosphatase